MRCEICGKRIVGKPIKTKIDSSSYGCLPKECSRFGKVQREPRKPRKSPVKRRPARSRGPEPIYEVVEGLWEDHKGRA